MKQKHLSATCTLNPAVLKLNGSELPNLNSFKLFRNNFPVDRKREVLNSLLFEIGKIQICHLLTKKLQKWLQFSVKIPSSVTPAANVKLHSVFLLELWNTVEMDKWYHKLFTKAPLNYREIFTRTYLWQLPLTVLQWIKRKKRNVNTP